MTNIKHVTDAAINAWKQQISRIDQIVAETSDADLEREVAPGRNRLYYLIGHLAAVHDRMFPVLGIGERRYAALDAAFIENPDSKTPSIAPSELKRVWSDVNSRLIAALEQVEPEVWLSRHNSVSDEDFARNPLRHRLSVLMTRTAHAAFHLGQMQLTQ
ncbi:MAG TPA: DinB family protein [Gemmatimonadaceae bacterium]|nr:DinB family protein [Gemmatimonadaceae bacterium]